MVGTLVQVWVKMDLWISNAEQYMQFNYQMTTRGLGRFTLCAQTMRIGSPKMTKQKTYSTGDSLVVTDPTTSLAISSLSMGERTGSRVFHYLWPYVVENEDVVVYIGTLFGARDGLQPHLPSVPLPSSNAHRTGL